MAPLIVLIGFMGAGKSGAARRIAAELGTEALDADDLLQRELGEPIESFFLREGEPAFREHEERVALAWLAGEAPSGAGGRPPVVALGGGAIESPRVREALARHFPVWCRADEGTAWERSHGKGRPLAVDRDEFARRYRARMPLYEGVARAVLPENRSRDRAGRAAPWLPGVAGLPGGRLAWAHSASAEYPAVVGEGALGLLPVASAGVPELDGSGIRAPRRWFVVGDREALRHHQPLLPDVEATIEVEAAEERKTLAEVERVLRELARAGATRDDGVLAFGGGMVGDLAGFCAATYQRGVPVAQAPTTLIGQVDAAYGGKTGVDLPEAKNYAGAYHMPLAVLADPRTLATLPREELAAGFVEVVKTALIAGGSLWERVRELGSLDPDGLGDVIFACARTKLDIVAADERDAGLRAALNLGHTVGHAIETVTGYRRYRHGEAVGLGLLASLRLSGADDLRDEVREVLARQGLPVELDAPVAPDQVVAATELDKKRSADRVGFVLLERPGEPLVGRSVEPDSLRAAVAELASARLSKGRAAGKNDDVPSAKLKES